MSPDESRPESEGLLSRLASKITVPQVAGFALAASLTNADIRTGVMNTLVSPAHAEDWQDQGTTNNASADGEYIWCFGGDANGVHVRQIWDYGDGTSTTQIHDGTTTGTHVDGLDAAIEAYDSSVNVQEICIEDLDEARDEIKFYDFGNSQSFVVHDYINSGSISSITYLTGEPFYSGNIYDGRYFMADYSGSNPVGAYEQFESASPTEYYVDASDDLVTVVVNPDTDQVFAAKDFVTGEVFKYDNASTSSVTEDALGVYGEPRSWRDAADSSTGYNSFSALYDGVVHTIADMDSGAATDPDEDGDGEAASVDCDDTNSAINSSADEECDGVDNNCDGSTDGADSIDVETWYLDEDSDGVGGSTTQEACDQPSGHVATGGDCDDTDATKIEEADCATSSTRDPNCDLAVGDMMTDEVEVEAGEVICDDPEDMSEGTSEMVSGSGAYFDGENIRIAEGFGSEWEFTNADTNVRFAAAGLEVDAEDLVAPMSFGIVNLNANGATLPPSETGDECVPGSVDTEDESKILTMGYESGKYTLTGDHDLSITVSGAEWQGLEAQWSDVSSGQEDVVTAEECLDEENPDDTAGDDTGPDDTDDTAVIDDTDKEDDSATETGWQDTGGNGEAPVCGCTYDPSTGAMIPLIVTAGFLATRRRRTTKMA